MSPRASKEELIKEVVVQLEETLRSLRSGISEEWFTTEVTMPQLRGLFLLLRNGPSRMGDLAANLGISISSATGLIDKLVDRGLVERSADPNDRRSVICALSSKGRELAERLLQLRRSQWESRLEGIPEEQLVSASRGLKSLLRGLRELGQESETVLPSRTARR